MLRGRLFAFAAASCKLSLANTVGGNDMNDTAAAPPVDDIWATKHPELVAGRGYAWSPQAKPLTGAHALLRAAIFIYLAMQTAALLALGGMMYILFIFQSGGDVTGEMGNMLGTVANFASVYLPIGAIVVLVGCVIAYSIFVYRGMKNLHLSGARTITTSPGWAVGWSFIPFANIGMIFNVMRQIWVGSHDPVAGKYNPPFTIVLWWGCWIASGVVGRISDTLAPKDGDLSFLDPSEFFGAFMPNAVCGAISGALSIISCFCLMAIIKQITAAQESLRSTAAFDE